MDALINVVIPVFGIVRAGYLAGRFSVLGSESAVTLNRFVYFFALPALLFAFTARAPLAKVLNWPFIAAFIGAGMLTLCIALIVGRIWFRQDFSTLSMHGLTSVYGNVTYMSAAASHRLRPRWRSADDRRDPRNQLRVHCRWHCRVGSSARLPS